MVKSPNKLKLPAVFGRYVLLHRISRGGMGEIFLGKLGEIQGFEKPIIIKKLLPDLAQDQEFSQKFVAEAQITIKLSHGNIAQVYEVGMVDGEYFLAMEYVHGRDLRSLANRCTERRYTLSPDLCLLLVREVANALAYAHRRTDDDGHALDLVHCDISPPNVLVSYEGEVKVIDFGIARSAMLRGIESDAVGFGKFGYMAPEQLTRGAVLDRRTDIYATGVMMHELLTGRRLFKFPSGTNYREVARVVSAGRVSPPSHYNLELDARLDRLVMRALRPNPDERYPSAEELRDAVQQELYARNPTISTDDLAKVMGRLFAEEMEASRKVVSLLSETPFDSLEGELTGGASHTVSYALADLWSGSGPPPPTPAEPEATVNLTPRGRAARQAGSPPGAASGQQESLAVEPVASVGAALPSVQGTRKLSRAEKVAAASTADVPALPAPSVAPAPPPARVPTWAWSAAILVLLLGGGVTLGAYLIGAEGAPEPVRTAAAPGPGLQPAPEPEPPAPVPDSQPIAFAPEPVHLSPDLSPGPTPDVGPPRVSLRRPPRRRGAVTQASVQRKFRQVSKEYERFTRAYGQRLAPQWQKILFAHTYGSKEQDTVRKLNARLDAFRKQMRKMKR